MVGTTMSCLLPSDGLPTVAAEGPSPPEQRLSLANCCAPQAQHQVGGHKMCHTVCSHVHSQQAAAQHAGGWAQKQQSSAVDTASCIASIFSDAQGVSAWSCICFMEPLLLNDAEPTAAACLAQSSVRMRSHAVALVASHAKHHSIELNL